MLVGELLTVRFDYDSIENTNISGSAFDNSDIKIILSLALTKFLTISWMAKQKLIQRHSQSQKRRCSVKKAVLRNFTKWNSQENTCARDFWPATLLKSPWHRWFPVNFVKFLRTSFLKQQEHPCPHLRQITSALLVFPLDLCSHNIMKIKHLADCCSEILYSILVQFKVHITVPLWNMK